MKKFRYVAIATFSLMFVMPVLAGNTTNANDPSGVFINFVTSASGSTPAAAINVGTADVAAVTSTTSSSAIGNAVTSVTSLNIAIQTAEAQTIVNVIDSLPVDKVPASVFDLRARLFQELVARGEAQSLNELQPDQNDSQSTENR